MNLYHKNVFWVRIHYFLWAAGKYRFYCPVINWKHVIHTYILHFFGRIEACLSTCGEVAVNLKRIAMTSLVWIDPVFTCPEKKHTSIPCPSMSNHYFLVRCNKDKTCSLYHLCILIDWDGGHSTCELGFPSFQVGNACSRSRHEGSSESPRSPPCLPCQLEIQYLWHRQGQPHQSLRASYWHRWNAWTFSGFGKAGAGWHHQEVPRRRGRTFVCIRIMDLSDIEPNCRKGLG